MTLAKTKPYKSYAELVAILHGRGMEIQDQSWAARKLSQVGYYRMSGYWHTCRVICRTSNGEAHICPVMNKPLREDVFSAGTNFRSVFALYLFDKQLRLALLDALERIEIHIRSIIAHELGRTNALAYQDPRFIDPKHQTPRKSGARAGLSLWDSWQAAHKKTLERSRDDWIEWHRRCGKDVPIWAAIEAWDFGAMSKYFSLLKGRWRQKNIQRLGIVKHAALEDWLRELNVLRNRCAHHSRVWNQSGNPLPNDDHQYFKDLNLSMNARARLMGKIAILWYLLRHLGPNSTWLDEIADIVDRFPQVPGCPKSALGMDDEQSLFPRERFRQTGEPKQVRLGIPATG